MVDNLTGFVPEFVQGLWLNLQMALWSLVMGLILGSPLAWARSGSTLVRTTGSVLTALLRAAPTFVLIFFFLNVLGSWTIGPWTFVITPRDAVVMALGFYATAYVSDNLLATLQQRAGGQVQAWPLFWTAVIRAFFVMVLSTGFASAVGVQESVAVTMRTIERLPGLGDKLLLVACVMAFFTVVFQSIYALVQRVRDTLAPQA